MGIYLCIYHRPYVSLTTRLNERYQLYKFSEILLEHLKISDETAISFIYFKQDKVYLQTWL